VGKSGRKLLRGQESQKINVFSSGGKSQQEVPARAGGIEKSLRAKPPVFQE
jgi:hypothetical protein